MIKICAAGLKDEWKEFLRWVGLFGVWPETDSVICTCREHGQYLAYSLHDGNADKYVDRVKVV